MKTLILMRHGQAVTAAVDRTRELSATGVEQCRGVGAQLLDAGITLDRVLCSPATRARRTAELVAEGVRFAGAIENLELLYQADVGDYEDVLLGTPDAVNTLLIVAHNPTISDFATRIERSRIGFPPAGFCIQQRPVRRWLDLLG